MTEITKKITEISEVMSNGYHFVKMRFLLEDWERQAAAGNIQAQEAIKMIETFHRLCACVKGMK